MRMIFSEIIGFLGAFILITLLASAVTLIAFTIYFMIAAKFHNVKEIEYPFCVCLKGENNE